MNDAIYGGAALAGALTSFAAVPLWRAWCRRTGHVDDPGRRKIHQEPIPLAGGLAVLTGLILPLMLAVIALQFHWIDQDSINRIVHGFQRRGGQLGAIFGGAIGMTLLGWLDDRYELRPALKFAGQVAVAAVVAASGVRITLFVPNAVFSIVVTLLWIVTVTNAFNFLDNMNGLCAGLGVIAATIFGVKAAMLDQYLVASIAFLAAGALLGFLPFNFPRASVFLGDAGSHLTGYLLAVLAILPHFHSAKHPEPWAVVIPLLVLAIPLLDLCWVVMLRWRRGQPFHVGDTNHVSHRLERRGFTQAETVVLIWGAAIATGSMAFIL
ncbi:MAG: UDP-GlcNAc:undecaprenyl-phosphate/decaprenyl-phosphate GlcNAc-phosphate transferase [Verrucomicrobiota bacterium]|jgi:UDP-GlcNAc:undecaprenyl-phosphate GlcNAc-1-phosphate transferase